MSSYIVAFIIEVLINITMLTDSQYVPLNKHLKVYRKGYKPKIHAEFLVYFAGRVSSSTEWYFYFIFMVFNYSQDIGLFGDQWLLSASFFSS